MTLLLHRYRPFTVAALTALARQDAADRRFTAYAADMAGLIAKCLSRGKLELDPPSRVMAANDPAARAREDTRTGRQIITDLKAKLLGGAGAKRKGQKAAQA